MKGVCSHGLDEPGLFVVNWLTMEAAKDPASLPTKEQFEENLAESDNSQIIRPYLALLNNGLRLLWRYRHRPLEVGGQRAWPTRFVMQCLEWEIETLGHTNMAWKARREVWEMIQKAREGLHENENVKKVPYPERAYEDIVEFLHCVPLHLQVPMCLSTGVTG